VSLRSIVARAVYSTLLRLLTPAYLVRLWWRGGREPLYREFIGERLGDTPAAVREQPGGWVWVHAVSLGETLAAAPLVQALRASRPGMKLLLTHSTATGREAGASLLREGDRQAWLPFDTPGAVARFLDGWRPRVGMLMETEVWPNLLHAAARRGVPVVLANARLSQRSLARARRLDVLIRPAVATLAAALAQTDADAERLREAGAREVRVMGNLKFELTPDAALIERGRQWRRELARPVVLAAVTREGEEAPLLSAWAAQMAQMAQMAQIDAAVPRPLLVVVPRHPQRFDEVAALIGGLGLSLARRSHWPGDPPPAALGADVWLGDTLREMPLYYGLANVALLGGSFAPLGGQNLIEAAACGCPLLMGPHTFNFALAAELAIEAGAARRVADLRMAVRLALEMVRGDAPAAMAQRAVAFASAHRGAAQRMAALILEPPADGGTR
jgi:3-deoxy-D-manno-octulosonic-acid transferase